VPAGAATPEDVDIACDVLERVLASLARGEGGGGDE
jgi:hypothetical protein